MGLKEEGRTSMTGKEAQTIIGNLPIYGDDCYSITEYQEAKAMAIKALETLEEFERAQIITGGRLNGRTYAYKCGLEDGKRKALEQEPCEDAISREKVSDILKAEWVLDKPIEEWSVYRDVADLPSITPKDDVLDKIKEEIEKERVHCAMGLEIYYNEAIDDALRIIDRYKDKGVEE